MTCFNSPANLSVSSSSPHFFTLFFFFSHRNQFLALCNVQKYRYFSRYRIEIGNSSTAQSQRCKLAMKPAIIYLQKPAKKDVARPGFSGDFKRFIDQIKCELSINRSVFLPGRFVWMQERETWMFMLMHANMQPSLSAPPSSISAPHTYVR